MFLGLSRTSISDFSDVCKAILLETSPDFASASKCRTGCGTASALWPFNAIECVKSLGHLSATEGGG